MGSYACDQGRIQRSEMCAHCVHPKETGFYSKGEKDGMMRGRFCQMLALRTEVFLGEKK